MGSAAPGWTWTPGSAWTGRWWRGCEAQASDRLSASLGDGQGHLDREAQQEIGRSIIVDLLQAEAQERLSAGLGAWSMLEQDAVAKAVFDALFGLGRLQPLVDDDRIENIIITGHDTVRLELTDGTIIPGEPVADSDSELIEFLVFLASRSEVNARPFSAAQPRLHLRLDGGARLAAAAWVTSRPSVVIRRHRLRRVSLDDLVEPACLDPAGGVVPGGGGPGPQERGGGRISGVGEDHDGARAVRRDPAA